MIKDTSRPLEPGGRGSGVQVTSSTCFFLSFLAGGFGSFQDIKFGGSFIKIGPFLTKWQQFLSLLLWLLVADYWWGALVPSFCRKLGLYPLGKIFYGLKRVVRVGSQIDFKQDPKVMTYLATTWKLST